MKVALREPRSRRTGTAKGWVSPIPRTAFPNKAKGYAMELTVKDADLKQLGRGGDRVLEPA